MNVNYAFWAHTSRAFSRQGAGFVDAPWDHAGFSARPGLVEDVAVVEAYQAAVKRKVRDLILKNNYTPDITFRDCIPTALRSFELVSRELKRTSCHSSFPAQTASCAKMEKCICVEVKIVADIAKDSYKQI